MVTETLKWNLARKKHTGNFSSYNGKLRSPLSFFHALLVEICSDGGFSPPNHSGFSSIRLFYSHLPEIAVLCWTCVCWTKKQIYKWKVPYFPVANTALIPRRGNRRNCIQILNWISVFWHDNYNRIILSQFRQYHRHYGGHWWRRMIQSAWSMKASWEFVMMPNIHVSICISLLKSIHTPPIEGDVDGWT